MIEYGEGFEIGYEAAAEDVGAAIESAGSLDAIPATIRKLLRRGSEEVASTEEDTIAGYDEGYADARTRVLEVLRTDLPVEEQVKKVLEAIHNPPDPPRS